MRRFVPTSISGRVAPTLQQQAARRGITSNNIEVGNTSHLRQAVHLTQQLTGIIRPLRGPK